MFEISSDDMTDEPRQYDTYDEAVSEAMLRGDGWQVAFLTDLSESTWETVWPQNGSNRSLDELRQVHGLDWRTERQEALVVYVPAGTYFLGDPCYAVSDALWMPWLEAADYTKNSDLIAEINGVTVIGFKTAWGDGIYTDRAGHEYSVDAGLLGLTPQELGWAMNVSALEERGLVVTFEAPTMAIQLGRGNMVFGTHRIDTR